MNHFRQHIPGFVDMGGPTEFDFNTTEELLNSPLLARYKNDDFVAFEYSPSQHAVIAVSDSGYKWWVVGFASKPIDGLKEWKPKYREGEKFS
mgnify:CR=1 FL=1